MQIIKLPPRHHTTITTYSQSIKQLKALAIEIILVAVPEGTANRQIIGISCIATQTRKSLVKGERFIRAVWMAEMMSGTGYSSTEIAPCDQVAGSVRFSLESDFYKTVRNIIPLFLDKTE